MTQLRDPTVPHEPADACRHVHCHEHHIDEEGEGYRWCLECGHLYRTETELVAEYNKGVDLVNASPVPRFPVPPELIPVLYPDGPPAPDPGPIPHITRGNEAWFCPLCMHDF